MKLFVLLSRVPFPTEKGDKLRAFHQLRCLSKHNEIILCALSDSPLHPEALTVLKSFCSEVHILKIGKSGLIWNLFKAFINGNPLQVGYFYRTSAAAKINKLIVDCNPDHIYCQLIRVSEYVKDSNISKTLDYQDIFSIGAKRRAEKSNFFLRQVFMLEYRRLVKYEYNILSKFNHTTIISQPDRDLLTHPSRNNVHIIPNGVDHDYFAPQQSQKEFDLVFTGNMGYPPNIDAARYIVNEILPLVRNKIPNINLLLAGATPHAKVLALAGNRVKVSGWMEDIRASYASSRIFLAPMRIGTGLQNKLLEAMAMQLPCITSQLANQALGAEAGTEIMVGNNAEEYAAQIIKLLLNPDFASKTAVNGHNFVKSKFSWENTAESLQTIFNTR